MQWVFVYDVQEGLLLWLQHHSAARFWHLRDFSDDFNVYRTVHECGTGRSVDLDGSACFPQLVIVQYCQYNTVRTYCNILPGGEMHSFCECMSLSMAMGRGRVDFQLVLL